MYVCVFFLWWPSVLNLAVTFVSSLQWHSAFHSASFINTVLLPSFCLVSHPPTTRFVNNTHSNNDKVSGATWWIKPKLCLLEPKSTSGDVTSVTVGVLIPHNAVERAISSEITIYSALVANLANVATRNARSRSHPLWYPHGKARCFFRKFAGTITCLATDPALRVTPPQFSNATSPALRVTVDGVVIFIQISFWYPYWFCIFTVMWDQTQAKDKQKTMPRAPRKAKYILYSTGCRCATNYIAVEFMHSR